MSHVNFTKSFVDVGVERYPFYRQRPDVFAGALQLSTKRYARLLEEVFPDFGHRRMLEVVATAAGFPNWHAFQTSTARLIADYEPRANSGQATSEDIFQPFLKALPLLIQVAQDSQPTPQQKSGLERHGHQLANALSALETRVRDVIAKYHGAESWDALCSRKPEDSKLPLYSFTTGSDGGRFRWSSACHELVEELDELWIDQPYEALPANEKEQVRDFIMQVTAQRPDFLEGLLVKAHILNAHGRHQEAGSVLKQAIEQADALISKKFKGEISWYVIENRFYHRLLYNYMEWCLVHGSVKEAIRLARRQLRLNKSDNMGVRIQLPILLTLNGEYGSTATALRRLESEDVDADVALVRSLCELAMGNYKNGTEWFIRSLFELPAIRMMVEDGEFPSDHHNKEWFRAVIPDLDAMADNYDKIITRFPMVEAVLDAVLEDQDVSKAEARAAALFEKVRSRASPGSDGIDYFFKWIAFKKESPKQLAAEHYQVWSEEFLTTAEAPT